MANSFLSHRRFVEWQLVFWGVFAVAFIGIGLDVICRVQQRPVVRNQSPTNSTDATLQRELRTVDGSKIIAHCLKDLPVDMPVFVVFPESRSISLAGILNLQLALPHPIKEYRTLQDGDRSFEEPLRAAKRGVVFFLAIPPAADLGETVQLSPMWWFTKLKGS